MSKRNYEEVILKRKKRFIIALSSVAAAAAVVLLSVFVIAPAVKYGSAVKLMKNGEYNAAIEKFVSMGDYRDSLEHTLACINERDGTNLTTITTSEETPWCSITPDGEFSFISSNYSDEGHIVIPQVIDGVVVTKISDKCFYNSFTVLSMELPDTVTEIGDSAFYYCTSMRSIETVSYTPLDVYKRQHLYLP